MMQIHVTASGIITTCTLFELSGVETVMLKWGGGGGGGGNRKVLFT